MARRISRLSLVLALGWCSAPLPARAQAPTIVHELPPAPGSMSSTLGPAPGSGGGIFDNPAGSGAMILSGRPGVTAPHVPVSIATPGSGQGPTSQQVGIAAPKPQPRPMATLYGTFSLTEVAEDEGPANGLTLDLAIDRMLRANLDLQSKFFEIPQAQADILQAALRTNPVFYADSQLVPYGQFNRVRVGGPTQYDVNVSHPFDLSRKRQARTLVAARAKRVLEAEYQDAVRLAIHTVYLAFVDVLASRQALRYSRRSVEGIEKLLAVERLKYQQADSTRADVGRVEILRETAIAGLLDAEEQHRRAKRALAPLLGMTPADTDAFEVRGTIFDHVAPPPPLKDLYQIALSARPDLATYRLGIERAKADVRLARANRLGDVYVLVQPYTLQDNTPYGNKSPISWALGATVPVPLYNRNQGNIQRAKLNVAQTQTELASRERQLLTEVAHANREYAVTRDMVMHLEQQTLPTAARMLSDSYRLYTAGDRDLTDYLNAQREYNTFVKQYLDTVIRHRRSMLALNTALGQRILP